MVKVLFICTVCGSGFPGEADPGDVGTKMDRLCYDRDCLRMQPHYVAESPNWNRNEVQLPPEIPAFPTYYRDKPGGEASATNRVVAP